MDDIIKAIRERTKGQKFGYGLCTAEPYVRKCLEWSGAGDAFRVQDPDAAIKHAGEMLAYASPDMVIEEKASTKFADLLPDGMEAPANTIMVIRHILTSTKEDRDNDILEVSGAQLDPKAPLLWQHMHTMPIGKVLGEHNRTKSKLSVVSAIVGGEKQTPLNDLAHDAATLVEADVLRFSHGFRALEFNERERKNEDDWWPGFHITKFEVMEASLVSVPSNDDAQVESFASQKFKSDFFKSFQKKLKAQTKAQVRGVDFEDEGETQLLLKLGGAEVTVTASKKSKEQPEVEKVDISAEKQPEEKGVTVTPFSEETPVEQAISEVPEDSVTTTEEKEVVLIEGDDEVEELTYERAAAFVIAKATDEQLEALHKTVGAILSVREMDAKACNYRALVG